MEEQVIKNLYTKYLEELLEIEYSSVFVKSKSIELSSKKYLTDKDGNAISDSFDSINKLDDGRFVACNIDSNYFHHYVFFDQNGNITNRLDNVVLDSFSNGIARVRTENKPILYGFVKQTGEVLGEIKWGYYSGQESEGLTSVQSASKDSLGKYGYIDEKGELAIPCIYSYVREFHEGLAYVGDGDEYFFINKKGEKKFSASIGYECFSEGLVGFTGSNNKVGVKNTAGEVVISPSFDTLSSFENGVAKVSKSILGKRHSYYIDHTGDKVKVVSLNSGMKYIKKFNGMRYYNSLSNTYDDIDFIPFKDLDTHLLCVDPNTQELFLYNKTSKAIVSTGQKYDSNNVVSIWKLNEFLYVGASVFYDNGTDYVQVLDNFDVSNIASYNHVDNVMGYSEFANKVVKDKDFYQRIVEDSKKVKESQMQEKLKAQGEETDKKRQEIIDELERLKGLLSNLDKTAGERSRIDNEMLFRQVGDHFEIKEEFIGQLKYLDLAYIDFANVKVSGIDFSGTNASLNPQSVYKKDMSNGVYDGLSFVGNSFNGVNIKGAKFRECNLDFVNGDGVIKDDNTEFLQNTVKF